MNTSQWPVHYEPHPVSPERKAELRAKGLKILDARFAPQTAASEVAQEKPARKHARKQTQGVE